MNTSQYLKSRIKMILKFLGEKPVICEDIATWATARSIPVHKVSEPVYDEFLQICEGDQEAKRLLEFHLAEYTRPQSLVLLDDAKVRDEVGFVFLPDGSVCEQGTWFRPYLVEHRAFRAYFRPRRLVEGDVFSLLGMFSEGYFHWFHDTLPRLLEALPHLPAGVRFLVHSEPRSYQLDSLEALGITRDALLYQAPKCDSFCEHLWFITPSGNSIFGSGATLRELAVRIRRAYAVSSGGSKRIYISRKKASRSVLNENALVPALKRHGFEIVHMEDLTFRDQVLLCSDTKFLVGPHGAGLTNLLYCNENAVIGEIATTEVFPFYLGMSRQLGHQYRRFIAEKSGVEEMTVNVKAFESWLDELVSDAA